ncbi:MAG: M56 family metallopeptidase [Clostridia bacterium]|nr:M56 family metallopeptidase [Clostridia bacterium]
MDTIFQTVLILSSLGFVLTAVLLCLKPITAKKFPAGWQYFVWLAVLFLMLIPVYRLIPAEKAQEFAPVPKNETAQSKPQSVEPLQTETLSLPDIPPTQTTQTENTTHITRLLHFLPYLWLLGVFAFLLFFCATYFICLFKKRKNAVRVSTNPLFEYAKHQLKIKRNISLRMSPDVRSPMLVGVLFPVVYVPCRNISDESLRMIFLHELTHYKRKDLFFKWLSLFANAIHWFNPLSYLLCANISEACEIACDMAVTKKMSEAEQKVYMKTILTLAE